MTRLADLPSDGKAGVREVLIASLGIEAGQTFTICVNGIDRKYRARKIHTSWPLEQIQITCVEVGRENGVESLFSVPFFEAIPETLEVIMPKAKKVEKGDYHSLKFKQPVGVQECIELFHDMEAAHFFSGEEMRTFPQLKNELTVKVLARVIGILQKADKLQYEISGMQGSY